MYIDEAIMEMEANEFSTGTYVGLDGFLDGGTDNVGETRAGLIVIGFGELSKRGAEEKGKKEKGGNGRGHG